MPNLDMLLDEEEQIESGEWTLASDTMKYGTTIFRAGEWIILENLRHKIWTMGSQKKEVSQLVGYRIVHEASRSHVNEFYSKKEAYQRLMRMVSDKDNARASQKATKKNWSEEQLGVRPKLAEIKKAKSIHQEWADSAMQWSVPSSNSTGRF